ncbi:hypothetical protein HAL013_05430 [Helicobacter ailurogastricus]|uniref:Uncharacterized protein n=1 Tax=Helicobacter ailurogastricus TaxID=1578720 RepID=A0A0K2XG91_9HELI|nr:hypothetical protein HAL011_07500 [Helicobacter ailurogastricus]CRF42373.1 hypothetical protein HAL013_05430 [Helicobacter ailurogastricus]CRF44628.1 hypothetical protein HAL09_12220 [Helicobacter ailurogastricus]
MSGYPYNALKRSTIDFVGFVMFFFGTLFVKVALYDPFMAQETLCKFM